MGSDVQPGTEMEIIVEETISVKEVSSFIFMGEERSVGGSGKLCYSFEVLKVGRVYIIYLKELHTFTETLVLGT